MIVNGCQLPASFIDAVQQQRLKCSRGSWPLREPRDSAGRPLETELGEVYDTVASLQTATDALPHHFVPDGDYGEPLADRAAPGVLPDIIDFSQIVCFGIAGGGEPFCFDFRTSPQHPSVICWDDIVWRQIAPDFDAFLNLFDLTGDV